MGYECEKYERLNEKISTMEHRSNNLEECFGSDRETQHEILQRVKSLEKDVDSKDVGYNDRILIVTSPEITDNYGNVLLHSLVEPSARENEETHTDIARRLVKEKTGIDIPAEDITSCQSMDALNTTFRIVFGNTRRNSAFDLLSTSIMTGESMTSKNVDICFEKSTYMGRRFSPRSPNASLRSWVSPSPSSPWPHLTNRGTHFPSTPPHRDLSRSSSLALQRSSCLQKSPSLSRSPSLLEFLSLFRSPPPRAENLENDGIALSLIHI